MTLKVGKGGVTCAIALRKVRNGAVACDKTSERMTMMANGRRKIFSKERKRRHTFGGNEEVDMKRRKARITWHVTIREGKPRPMARCQANSRG